MFRACLARRGARARDDRLFLEALHNFTVNNITWRARRWRGSAIGTACGNGSTRCPTADECMRERVRGEAGVFEDYFAILAGLSETADLVRMFASTVIRAHVSAAGVKGGRAGQALGQSPGGFGANIHLKTDHDGLPIASELKGGEAADSPMFGALIDTGPNETARAVIGDKGSRSRACEQPPPGGGQRREPGHGA